MVDLPRQLSNADSAGTILGQSETDLISFYGATPLARPAATAQSAVATTAITVLATTATSTEISVAVNDLITSRDAIIVLANQIRTDLASGNLNLIKGSA